MQSIHEILQSGLAARPALGAPSDATGCFASLSYGGLLGLAGATSSFLRGFGIGRSDRVAIVLPNGPEMAAAFLCVGSAASTAPLNPGYRADEFGFYLSDLGAKALVVEAGSGSPALEVARDRGIAVIFLERAPGAPAGRFVLRGETAAGPASEDPPHSGPEDEALVLHTSGTTSRPKVVPLRQRNLAASARHIRETLGLSEDDIGLNIMPLFHIHGLIASLLSSMSAGARVVCTPGFNALKVYQWFEEVRPSWYTAVPTMHQAILARARRNPEVLAALKLRFARSSSSSLPAPVMAELEATFGCPVIEAYGMTEAAHQMASNRLPPGLRKAGTVGAAAGPEVAIMGPGGEILAQGGAQDGAQAQTQDGAQAQTQSQTGEIVIRGPNVFSGYENNPEANATAFADGWFRTGDQGYFDADGYLAISGRLKEIINRGGEKIAPREVDDVLQAHPAVAQVVTFALPHPRLGEEVAAVVVLNEGRSVDEAGLRAFAAEKLADFKVPRKILFREEIPKGATGKLQRIGLAEKLGIVP